MCKHRVESSGAASPYSRFCGFFCPEFPSLIYFLIKKQARQLLCLYFYNCNIYGENVNNLKKIVLATALLGAFSGAANAELISTHYITNGDNRATLDTTTGKEWLDLSFTDSRSINWILNETKKGGSLEGWRLPLYDEVRGLMSYVKDESKFSEFISLFGDTRSFKFDNYTRTWSQGLVLNDDGNIFIEGAYHDDFGGGENLLSLEVSALSYSQSSSNSGVFLVSNGGLTWSSRNDAEIQEIQNSFSVPVPLLGASSIAMLSLFGARRKSK